MKIYGIGGLGADARMFEFLNLDYPIEVLEWIDPEKGESLSDYAVRMSEKIKIDSDFCLLGVSFGGMLAVEMSKLLSPKKIFLISSAACIKELPVFMSNLLLRNFQFLIPEKVIHPPEKVTHWLFSIKREEHRRFLTDIIKNTDKRFMGWAIKGILTWGNQDLPKNLIRIHGTRDRLLPCSNKIEYHKIEGGHAIVMEKASEVSNIINLELRS